MSNTYLCLCGSYFKNKGYYECPSCYSATFKPNYTVFYFNRNNYQCYLEHDSTTIVVNNKEKILLNKRITFDEFKTLILKIEDNLVFS